MRKVKQLSQSVNLLTVIAIATSGTSIPAIAGNDTTTSQSSLQLAQSSLVGQCRAAKLQIPVFTSANATSAAVGLLAIEDQVTLADSAVGTSGFIAISSPVQGYVHAVNLKTCSGGGAVPPGDKGLCRQVIRPPQGLLIRREPTSASAQVGQVAYLGQVTLSTSPTTVKQADNRNWIEISSPARGWVSNGLLTERESNLVYCK